MGYKVLQTARVKFGQGGKAVKCTACKGGHELRDNHLVSCPCFRVHQACGYSLCVCSCRPRIQEGGGEPHDNNQRPDIMAANIVDGKSNRSQMAIDVSVANTLSAKPNADTQEKVIKAREKSETPNTTTLDEQRMQSSYQRW